MNIGKYLASDQLISILMKNNMIFKGYVLEYDEDNIVIQLDTGNIIILNCSDVYILKIILEDSDSFIAPKENISDENINREDLIVEEYNSEFDIPYIDVGELPDNIFETSNSEIVESYEERAIDMNKLRAKNLSELHLEKVKFERENIGKKLIENKGTTGVSYGLPRAVNSKEPGIINNTGKKA
jgi:hypothetical protein